MNRNIWPNVVSTLRIILSPLFLYLFVQEEFTAALIAFFVAGLTDWLDGWLARVLDAESDTGRWFDPLADKILTTLSFSALAWEGYAPWWAVVLIVFRDIYITWLRDWASSVKEPLETSKVAKLKTATQMTFIFCALLMLSLEGKSLVLQHWVSVGTIVVAVYTFLSGVHYTVVNRRLLQKHYGTLKSDETVSHSAVAIGSLGGIGFLPPAPGTFASLAALGVAWFCQDWMLHACIAGVAIICGYAIAGKYEQTFGHDNSSFVIDEFAAMMLLFASPWFPQSIVWQILGFGLFRVFDILKPWPVSLVDDKSSPSSIMTDDLIAVVLAGLCFHAIFGGVQAMPLLMEYF